MKYLTLRPTQTGEIRHYFRRRGVPLLRLFGDPSEREFAAQYAYACGMSPQIGQPWDQRAVRAAQRAIYAMRRVSEDDRCRYAASRLARSVNSRARHQYRVESEIDTKWVLDTIKKQNGRCAVSGMPFSYERGLPTKDRRNPLAPSVDRIDCALGYTKSNCRVVILAVNIALNLWGDALFLDICRATISANV